MNLKESSELAIKIVQRSFLVCSGEIDDSLVHDGGDGWKKKTNAENAKNQRFELRLNQLYVTCKTSACVLDF